jgi:uncharacterized Ntn-hydrolase superfamily protein
MPSPRRQPVATFSIVAYDPNRREWGVGVQSKFLAVGAVVPFARAGAGAVATQSYANMAYGPEGLALMDAGRSAEEAIATLVEQDEGRDLRQVGMVDAQGNAAAYTGAGCYDWAGHIVGDGFTCQGNILVPGTVEAMVARFEAARKESGELAEWLVAALAAGQDAGGDSRGRQAAAVVVVRAGGGYGGNNDRYLDLRVDDDPFPIRRLAKLVEMHHLFFGEVDPTNVVPLPEVAGELQIMLRRTGHYDGPAHGEFDSATRTALRALVGAENLEERWDGTPDEIDALVLAFLRERFGDDQ